MAGTNDRRAIVNLSVVAGSAAMFAVAWAGIAEADSDRYAPADIPVMTAMAVAPVQPAIRTGLEPATVSGDQAATPSVPRQVVIVRQSRAS